MTNSGAEPRAIVAAHGDLAAGLVSAVQLITGRGAALRALSNAGLDAVGLESAMRDAIAEHGATVVFTDLPAGSCTIAARKATRGQPAVAVVTGANLPMLLEFTMKAGAGREAADRAAGKGRDAIAVAPAPGAGA